jgi:AbrB family looped-hinge helix DNA binding protein
VPSEQLIKITTAGTISIPKDFRKFLELQKGDYVKVIMDGDHLLVKKVVIS